MEVEWGRVRLDARHALELRGMHARGALDGHEDPRVRPATADVVLEPGPDRLVIGFGRGCEEADRRQDHPGRAVAALEGAFLEERPLDRVELAGWREALDGQDLVPLGRRQPRSAAPDRPPVDEDSTGPADALAAAGLRPGDVELVAQDPEQAPVRLTGNVAATPLTFSRRVPDGSVDCTP